jgi:transposase-like protein/IS1 family transposase
MIAPACKHERTKKCGHDRKGNQRFRCLLCGQTWIEQQPKPLGEMRIDKAKAVLCLRLLLEGNSIRSVERIVGVNRNTILSLLELVGRRALRFWGERMSNLAVANVQVDEIWGFIGMKEKTRQRLAADADFGDAYCFTAIERDTKLMVAWHLGKRSPRDTEWFADKLYRVTTGRFQLTTDGYIPYVKAMPKAFGEQVDFAQLVKIYRATRDGAARYSPAEIIDIHTNVICGNPDEEKVCTSHVERANLSIRMGVRRMTRLTNAFSKKWENHEYHLALYFLYYNFCRTHQTLKTTPAVTAGLTDKQWSIERMLNELATQS